MSPAAARSRLDFPEPLVPTMPMASPWWATKETPRTAWTSEVCPTLPCRRHRSRLSSEARPLLTAPARLAPKTRYLTCTLSTMSDGGPMSPTSCRSGRSSGSNSKSSSLSAIGLLALPEVEETHHQEQHGPAEHEQPLVPVQRNGRLVGQRLPAQVEGEGHRLVLEDWGEPVHGFGHVLREAPLDRKEHAGAVHDEPQQELHDVQDVRCVGDDPRHDERAAQVEHAEDDHLHRQ